MLSASFQHGFPFTDILIQYTPRWGEHPSVLRILPWVLLALVPLGLIVCLARYEMKLVSPLAACRLLGLRLLVLFLILFLIVLQPVLTWPLNEKPRETVVVAVDRSGSMDVKDPHRTPVEKLKIALALRLARDVSTDLQLQEWIEQLGTPDGIQWIADDEYPGDPERRRQVEDERRRQFAEICTRVDALKRNETIERLLADDGGGLLRTLQEKFDVELLGFDREARPYSPDQLDELCRKPEESRQADFTNLSDPLARILERENRGNRVRGVIVLTDGQHNPPQGDRPSPLALAEELGKQEIPIHPVGVGIPPRPGAKRSPAPPDVSVASISAPETVLKDVQGSKNINVTLEATVRANGLPLQELRVELHHEGKVIDHRILKHDGTDREYSVVFPTNLTKEGTHKLTVVVKPAQGEGYAGNNDRSALVKVIEDFSEVLMIDGESRWEYHYLATALLRDSLVKKIDRVLYEQPRLNPKLDDRELQKMGYPSRTLAQEPDALTPYDVIVLGDVTPVQLPLADRKRLEDFVAKRGGTLVIVAGKRSMPHAFPAPTGKEGEEVDPLLKLLPISKLRTMNLPNGFPVTLTDEGRKNSLLQMEGNPFIQVDETPVPPEELQRHYWGIVGELKPGAVSLAYIADPPLTDRAQRKKQQDEQALIVQHNYGRGKVLFVGIDSTWRWRYKTGDRFHHHFWGRLVRWAAGDKLVEGGTSQVRFGASHTRYDPGQEVKFMLRLGDDAAKVKFTEARMRVLRKTDDGEEVVAVVPLTRRDGQPRLLEGQFTDTREGDYRLEPDITELADFLRDPVDGKQPKPRPAIFEVTAPQSKEMVETAPDWEQLEKLSLESRAGGRAYSLEDALEAVEKLKQEEEKEEDRPEFRIWEWWPTLIVVLLLLTLEWAGRKLAGLP